MNLTLTTWNYGLWVACAGLASQVMDNKVRQYYVEDVHITCRRCHICSVDDTFFLIYRPDVLQPDSAQKICSQWCMKPT